MNIPNDLRYTKDHEWARKEGEHIVIGITDHAQSELGEIVFVEIETEGESLGEGEVFGTIEAVKTVSDLFMPLSGEVVSFNDELESSPELVNEDPYGKGWMIKILPDNAADYDGLMSGEEYGASL